MRGIDNMLSPVLHWLCFADHCRSASLLLRPCGVVVGKGKILIVSRQGLIHLFLFPVGINDCGTALSVSECGAADVMCGATGGACLLHLFHDGLEGFGVVHGEVGEHFAVDFDTGLVQLAHKLAVAHSFEA